MIALFLVPSYVYCQENTSLLCSDGIDNDGDGLIDCEDNECRQLVNNGCSTCGHDGLSFADVVIEFDETCASTNMFRDANQALGVSDDAGVVGSDRFVSLGEGGSLKLGFTNNILTNSGDAQQDMWCFEIGPAVESLNIELRPLDPETRDALIAAGLSDNDNDGFFEITTIAGATSGVDIDAFVPGFIAGQLRFDAVDLTDVDNGNCNSVAPGADIDAVCALTSINAEVCDNGIDDDFDGLVDCNDPDLADNCCCTSTEMVQITGDTLACIGDTVELNATGNFVSYRWNTGAETSVIQVSESGSYRVTATELNGCTHIDEIDVDIVSLQFVFIDTTICFEQTVVFFGEPYDRAGLYFDTISSATAVCGAFIAQIRIQSRGPGPEFLPEDVRSCDIPFQINSPFPVIWPDQSTSTSYSIESSDVVVAMYVDSNECTQRDTIAVELTALPQVYMPNAFSPNQDGVNDVFQPFFSKNSIVSSTLEIFDRWGNQLFETTEPEPSWNGISNKKFVDPGVYVWQLTLSDSTCMTNEVRTGDLMLIR